MSLVSAAMEWTAAHQAEWDAALAVEHIERAKSDELARIEEGNRTGVGPGLVEAGRDARAMKYASQLASEAARVRLMLAVESCWIDVLGWNLSVAGGLCRAYTAGDQAAEDIHWGAEYWSPGCGRQLVLR